LPWFTPHSVLMKNNFSVPAAIRIACLQFFLICISLLHPVKAQNLLFAKGFSNSQPLGGALENRGICVDGAGNRYVAGYFQNIADLDPGAGTQNLSSAGGNDIFLAKYDASGNYVWANRIGSTANDQAYALAIDASGNSYITGYFNGTVDFDPGAGTQNLSSAGSSDIFLAKYDASGNYVWAKNMGGTSTDIAYALAIDASGNSYITGDFASTADFDPGAGTQNLTSAGGTDIFLAKYDASGNYVWAKGMGGITADIGYGLAIDASGNSIITGSFINTADFDPGAGTQNLSSAAGSSDIFLAKYDASGNYVWAKGIVGTGADIGNGLAIDASGNSIITGSFSSTADFDPGAGTKTLTSAGLTDIFMAKYDASGNYVWAQRMGAGSNDVGYGLAIDASGNSIITGSFNSTADFDPGAGTQNLSSTGGTDIFLAKYDASGNYMWASQAGGTTTDAGYALAIDASGNSYGTGYFQNTADFDPGAGTASLTAGVGVANGYIWQLNSTGNYVSALALGGYSGSPLNDQGTCIRVDASGNSYITGSFLGTVDFDPGAGTQNLSAAGSSDIFLAKYDASGNYVWAKSMGGVNAESGLAMAIDASGNCYITGYFSGMADFDPGAGTQNLSSAGGTDIFLAKYDASGNYVWAKSMGSSSGNDRGTALAIDASGNSYITGYFLGTADFDPGAGTQSLSSAGGNDIFLAKYDASGNYIWAQGMGGTSNDVGYALAIDALGNSYITGNFYVTADFDPGAGTQDLTSAGSADIFLAKYDASGNYVWAKGMGATSIDVGYALAIDASGNSYITGNFTGTVDFDPGAGTQNLSSVSGSFDIFLAKYDASGNYVWAQGMGGTTNDIGYALAIDASGNSYVTGYFTSTADFDPGAGTQNLTSAGNNDIFLAKYDATGNYVWAQRMGGIGTDIGSALAVDASGNSYVTGYFTSTADFDPGAGTQNLTSINGNDIFIAQYGPGSSLPIRLESFAGQLVDNGAAVLLQWTTAAQEDHAYFEVERSSGGNDLAPLGRVPGCGTCDGRQRYSFTDHQPLSGKAYYRLKMVDKDGRAEYSKWISMYKNESSRSLLLYPAPTTGNAEAFYDVAGTARKIRISIFDAQGKVVQQRQQVLANGSNQLRFDLSAQAPGLYYVQLADQNGKILATGTAIRQ
jgi:hypothetical protein